MEATCRRIKFNEPFRNLRGYSDALSVEKDERLGFAVLHASPLVNLAKFSIKSWSLLAKISRITIIT